MSVNDFRRALVPAIRAPNGDVYVGPRGAQHIDIRHNFREEDGSPLTGDAGFVDTRNNKFHPKYGREGLNIDSQMIARDGAPNMGLPKEGDIDKGIWDADAPGAEEFEKATVIEYYKLLSSVQERPDE